MRDKPYDLDEARKKKDPRACLRRVNFLSTHSWPTMLQGSSKQSKSYP